jgi:hypothetical protein
MFYVPQELSDTTSNISCCSGAASEDATGLPKQPLVLVYYKSRFTAIGSQVRRFPFRLKAGSPRAVVMLYKR